MASSVSMSVVSENLEVCVFCTFKCELALKQKARLKRLTSFLFFEPRIELMSLHLPGRHTANGLFGMNEIPFIVLYGFTYKILFF